MNMLACVSDAVAQVPSSIRAASDSGQVQRRLCVQRSAASLSKLAAPGLCADLACTRAAVKSAMARPQGGQLT